MNELDKYNNWAIEPGVTETGGFPGSNSDAVFGLIVGMLRRWYIMLGIFVGICLIGIPAIWLIRRPEYTVTGFIRVAPNRTNILSGELDKGEIANYKNFVNTEAIRITSSAVVERVADELVDKNLQFFERGATNSVGKIKNLIDGSKKGQGYAYILKQAIANKVITASADRESELIRVTMRNDNLEEAKQIVDAFMREYMAIAVSDSSNTENQKLTLLENEQQLLFQKMENWRETIFQLGQEFGGTSLDGRYDIKLERVSSLLKELTKLESERVRLEIEMDLLDKSKDEKIDPVELVRIRQEYINSDSRVDALARNVTQFEQELIVARQRLAPQNPEIANKEELIAKFKDRLAELKEEAGQEFDASIATQTSKSSEDRRVQLEAALGRTKEYEEKYREMLAKEDTEAIEVGRKQLIIRDLEDQLDMAKERYDQYTLRIQELEIGQKLPARISPAQYADIDFVGDKRVKFTLATIFFAAACGLSVSFFLTKMDQRMWTPQDVTRSIDVKIIGTTAAFKNVDKKPLLPEQVEEDFHTICANLGLFGENGHGVPKRLVVTSPGAGDGKTTSAINLAVSLSRTNKKVLLVDGDLRKPDIAHFLNLPKGSGGLQRMIAGEDFEQVICRLPSTGLDVLSSDSSSALQAIELLAQLHKGQYIERICKKYDHIIIDTPPVLAFPDARLWAKMVGSVVLTSLAGRTTGLDLKRASQLIAQIDVDILGVILCNVQMDRGYYGYFYNYYTRNGKDQVSKKRASTKKFLMPIDELSSNTEELNS
ncbi:MAG: polysaccharide biosynthesis tyrosine autokinase [Sedimentisphaerales bacterium]|nr:polysaccharide biosynthesis tyrosine autokinase [Sedimentisphaerales bacterium]